MHASKARRIARDRAGNKLLAEIFAGIEKQAKLGLFQFCTEKLFYSKDDIDKTVKKLQFRGYKVEVKNFFSHNYWGGPIQKYIVVDWSSK